MIVHSSLRGRCFQDMLQCCYIIVHSCPAGESVCWMASSINPFWIVIWCKIKPCWQFVVVRATFRGANLVNRSSTTNVVVCYLLCAWQKSDSSWFIYKWFIRKVTVWLYTSITGQLISTLVKYRKYSSWRKLRRSTTNSIIKLWINQGIHVTCVYLILPLKVGLIMIGLTLYEIFWC